MFAATTMITGTDSVVPDRGAWRPNAIAETIYAWWSVVGAATGALLAVAWAWTNGGVGLVNWTLFSIFFVLTGVGVSAGLHRHFSHYAFGPQPWLRYALAILGLASGQGYLIRWVYDHRLHHQYADQPGDPHSPHVYESERLSGWRGLLHAHCLWLLRKRPLFERARIRDVSSDLVLMQLDRNAPTIALVSILVPGVIAGVLEGTWWSTLGGALWGGTLRMFLLNHLTWSVNSFGHSLGPKPQSARCEARNNMALGLLAFGDGWHGNHHLEPRAARHGGTWRQIDPTYWLILAFRRLGWVMHVHRASRRRQILSR